MMIPGDLSTAVNSTTVNEREGTRSRSTRETGINRVDEDLASRDIGSSVLPTAEKSPMVDFLGDEDAPPKEDKTRNIMDDDSWNVVEKIDVKREQGEKVLEPPTKPLPPLPKENPGELLEDSARQDKYEMSNDFLIAEAAKPSPPQRGIDSEHESVKRHQAPRPKETDYACPRPVGKKKQEIEIAPKEIFRDIGLGECNRIFFLYFVSRINFHELVNIRLTMRDNRWLKICSFYLHSFFTFWEIKLRGYILELYDKN